MQKVDFIYSSNLIDYEFAIKFMQDKVEKIISKKQFEFFFRWHECSMSNEVNERCTTSVERNVFT